MRSAVSRLDGSWIGSALAVGLTLVGCASAPTLNLTYSKVPSPATTRVFLVAGSHESANFAQEIVEQREIWRARGFRENQISCYYAQPCYGSARADYAQFRSLEPRLSGCHPASARVLRQDLKRALATSPETIYLYVTSHGQAPLSTMLASIAEPEQREALQKEREGYPVLDDYQLNLDSDPQGRTLHPQEKVESLQEGMNEADLFLTPVALFDALTPSPRTKKVVVLQGCYSGGFLEGGEGSLRAVPNVRVITATSADRVSFGCDVGEVMTVFGTTFNSELSRAEGRLMSVDWRAFHGRLARRIVETELAMDVSPSQPVYFSRVKGPGASRRRVAE